MTRGAWDAPAQVQALIANVAVGRKRDGSTWTAVDFHPYVRQSRELLAAKRNMFWSKLRAIAEHAQDQQSR